MMMILLIMIVILGDSVLRQDRGRGEQVPRAGEVQEASRTAAEGEEP